MIEQHHKAMLIEDWPFPVFLLGAASDEILWVNHASEEWLGRSAKRLLGQQVWDILYVDEDVQHLSQRCRAQQTTVNMRDCPIGLRETAERQPCHLTAFPSEGGIGLSIVFPRARPQDTRLGGQVVSGMGRLIAHELKNPLAGIKGAAQLLRDDVASEEGRSLIDLIGSEIDRIRRLADRMETLGDQDPTESERVNIHELLRQARRILQSAEPALVFSESYDPSLPHAIGHSDTLMQALLNLIKNASEAVEGKGEIRLETNFRSGVKGPSQDNKTGKDLPIEIRIIDNGPGISKTLLGQVFQPFVSTKSDGQGLGLALVSKVAAAHGGLIEVKSKPGQTVFSLLLPAPPTGVSQ